MLAYFWVIPFLPLVGFLINGLVGLWTLGHSGKPFSKRSVYWIACGSVLAALLLSLSCFVGLLWEDPELRIKEVELFSWISGLSIKTARGELVEFRIGWGMQLDPLSAVMILVVTGVGFLIHVYSIGYMYEEDGFYRYFAYLNLFMFMMLTLVLANNFLVMFVGWEGVGLCSYLLIGYYLSRKRAGDAAKKAFVVNRVGDLGFIIGMLMIFSQFGSLEFTEVFESVALVFPEPEAAWGTLSWIALLLFIGATGKSAQVPLYTWLPDAMEGPTPVSALIHAATMVTAGVYMVARASAIYSRAPDVLLLLTVVGIVTALLAASIALVQRDIKKVLAYSTISQLGYMFTALGVGAVTAGIFHLATHAFFKALLFLGAGSVIHALHHEQDMMKMGGLKRYLPTTWRTMLVGALAIAGVPPLAGFFSKDEILWRVFSSPLGHPLIWVIGVLVAGITAFYMFRLIFLTFYGEERFSRGKDHLPHESPSNMTLPLVVLAFGAIVVGFIGPPAWLWSTNYFEHFLEPALVTAYPLAVESGSHGHAIEFFITLISLAAAAVGIYLAYVFFLKQPAQVCNRLRPIYQLVYDKYYVDEVYDALFVNPCKHLGNFLSVFDRRVVDGLVNGSATFTRISAWLSGQVDIHIVDRIVNLLAQTVEFFSGVLRRLQTGLVQGYALFIVLGIILMVGLYLYLGV